MNNIDPVELTKGLPGIPCPIAKTLDVMVQNGHFNHS